MFIDFSFNKQIELLTILFGTDYNKIDVTDKIDLNFIQNSKEINIIDILGDPAPNKFKKLWIKFKYKSLIYNM